MKNKFLITIAAVFCSFLLLGFMSFPPNSENTPPGSTGSPADGKDCSSCHKAKTKVLEGIITSNIPGNKYVAGKTYTITVTLKGDAAKAKKFGFQVSPQNIKGKPLGKLVVTNAEETKLAGNGKYINQTKIGVDGSGTKTWTFDWIAPPKTAGEVVFYGGFVIGGKPETLYTSTLAVK